MKPYRNVIQNKGTVGVLAKGIWVGMLVTGVSLSACSPDKKTANKGTVGQKAPKNESQLVAKDEPKPVVDLNRKDPAITGSVSALADGFTSELVTFPEPNAYRMNLKANPKSDFRGLYKVFRSTDSSKDFVELVTLNWDRPEFIQSTFLEKSRENEAQTFEQVEPGKLYYYKVQMLDSTVGTLNLTKDPMAIIFPQDFVFKAGVTSIPDLLKSIKTESNRAELTGFNRVFLSKGARVRVEDQTFSIVTNELISSGGDIETFLATDQADQGIAGRDGGFIQIQAKKATGKITITARGEMGGKGVDGSNGQPGNPGVDGENGRWGVNNIGTYRHTHCSEYRVNATFGCVRPRNGGNGTDAQGGGNGQAGLKGGNSGTVLIKIEDVSIANLVFENKGGKGGKGGDPGKPGARGAPGKPGIYMPKVEGFDPLIAGYCRCDNGSEPHEGLPGLPAHEGLPGLSGDAGKAIEGCLLLGEKKTGCTGEVTWTGLSIQ